MSPLWYVSDALGYVTLAAAILYSPFARTWLRAILVPFLWACASSCLSLVLVAWHPQELIIPASGYFLLPFLAALSATMFRAVKKLLFYIPALKHLETLVRSRCERAPRPSFDQ